MLFNKQPIIRSIKEKCKVCYTCVRLCPAKAIRIEQGQATVIPERCIGCGNCVRECSQNAKEVLFDPEKIKELLRDKSAEVIAMVAPSFPVEFDEIRDYRVLVGMLKKLGFAYVNEVAFGADLVAQAYNKLLNDFPRNKYIASTCPAVVTYIRYYYPDLVPFLAPIVSPMIATSRVLKRLHKNCRIVFIGPCIAKKAETEDLDPSDNLDCVLTFTELRKIFAEMKITPNKAVPANFDPPYASRGVLFPIARGLLETAGMREDLIDGDVIATDGQVNFIAAIKEFEKGTMNTRLLEILSCNGCIMGAGITKSEKPLFERRASISNYAKQRIKETTGNLNKWEFQEIGLSRAFSAKDQRTSAPSEEKIHQILEKMGKFTTDDLLNCGACGYDSCRDHAIAILLGLAESEMCLPYTIDQLKVTVQKLADSNEEVASIQDALLHAEKLASMGQLAAGVAHEVNNPLGVVLLHAHLLKEKCQNDPALAEDCTLIVEQADRCRRIISGLLNFARQNKTIYQPVNLHSLIKKSVKSVSLPANIAVSIQTSMKNPVIEIDQDQMFQALTNLYTNAQAAMPQGGTLTITLEEIKDKAVISVADTGTGIPQKNLSAIFSPFFTTKQIGKGTGLGLSILYGIIKMHNGHIKVVSNDDPQKGPTGSTFTIIIPKKELERNENN